MKRAAILVFVPGPLLRAIQSEVRRVKADDGAGAGQHLEGVKETS